MIITFLFPESISEPETRQPGPSVTWEGRQLKIRVRALGRFGDEIYGLDLMREAFGPNGLLSDPEVLESERGAVRELFSGAYGAFRNQRATAHLYLDDVRLASEVVVLADLLLRRLDRIDECLGSVASATARQGTGAEEDRALSLRDDPWRFALHDFVRLLAPLARDQKVRRNVPDALTAA
jgi:hypothetical protein